MEQFRLKILSDVNCDLYVDTEFKSHILHENLMILTMNQGEYYLKFINTVNPKYSMSRIISLDRDRVINVSFKEEFVNQALSISEDSDIRAVQQDDSLSGYYRNLALGMNITAPKWMGLISADPYMDEADEALLFDEDHVFKEGFCESGEDIINRCGEIVLSNAGFEDFYDDWRDLYYDNRALVKRWDRPEGGKCLYGYLDRKGNLIIDFQYELATRFYKGFACVFRDERWSVIDSNGKDVFSIDRGLSFVDWYNDGDTIRILVRKDQKYGVVTKDYVIIPFEYDSISLTANGYYVLGKSKGDNGLCVYGLYNRVGWPILPIEYDSIRLSNVTDPMPVFFIEKGSKVGAFSSMNGILFPCEYNKISFYPNNEHIVIVEKDDEIILHSNGQCRTLNKGIIDDGYEIATYRFFNQHLLIRDEGNSKGSRCCLTNYSGSRISRYFTHIDVREDWYSGLYEVHPICLFEDEKGQGLINAEGKVLCYYDKIRPLSDSYYAVKDNDLWGIVNKEGIMITPCQYSWILGFSSGLAAVMRNDKWGYINDNNQIVIALQFDIASSFWGGAALVFKNGKHFHIDKNGFPLY